MPKGTASVVFKSSSPAAPRQFRYDGSTESSTSSSPGQDSSPRSSEKSSSLTSEPNHFDVFSVTGYNGVLGTNNVVWTTYGTAAPAATTGTAGVAALATQAEVDAGAVTNKIVTPQTLAGWASRLRKFAAAVGDGSATSIAVTHNFNTKDVEVYVYENAGSFRAAQVEVQHSSANAVTLLFDTAPAANAYRAVVIG